MKTLISAVASELMPGQAPSEIVFIPVGRHWIKPTTHPKGIMVELPEERGGEIARKLQASLDKRSQSNPIAAWFDLEHTRKAPASGYPKQFRFEPGVGIMASVDWSSAGRLAIEGRDVGYFSPEFYVDNSGVPLGIPETGPIGGLVAEPAFRSMPRIVAAGACEDEELHGIELLAACLVEEADQAARIAAGAEADRSISNAKLKSEDPTLSPYERLVAAFAEG